MWDAIEGVKDNYSRYGNLVWDAGRVLETTWSSTNDPLHNNSVDKQASETNKDKGRDSNTDTETNTVKGKSVCAATKRQRPFDT